MTGSATIICAAGRDIGLGHLQRSRLVSAKLSSELKLDLRLLIISQDKIQLRQNETVLWVDIERIWEFVLAESSNPTNSVVIVDIPWKRVQQRAPESRPLVAKDRPLTVGIDGPVRSQFFDLRFFPSFSNHGIEGSSSGEVLYGWDCYLLPNRGRATRTRMPAVIVSTGGSDALGLGEIWPRILNDELPAGTRVTWLRGELSPRPNFPDRLSIDIELAPPKAPIYGLFETHSFGLSTYGTSTFEMLASGVATVTYSPSSGKLGEELTDLDDFEVCEIGKTPEDAVKRLAKLMKNPRQVEKITGTATRLLNQKGEDRLTTFISSGLRKKAQK